MEDWKRGMLAHSRLQSHRRLIDRTRGEIEAALEVTGAWNVAVSGGKDSTLLLHLVREVAGEIDAEHGEEEVVAPQTEAFVAQLGAWPGVTLFRTACPVRHSAQHTSWDEEPYLRPLPVDAQWFESRAARNRWRTARWIGTFVGTRGEESSARRMSYRMHGALYRAQSRQMTIATPLHAWKLADVFAYLLSRDVPYHPGYDRMRALGVPLDAQRIGPATDYRALEAGALGWLRMTWPEQWMRTVERYPWMAQYA